MRLKPRSPRLGGKDEHLRLVCVWNANRCGRVGIVSYLEDDKMNEAESIWKSLWEVIVFFIPHFIEEDMAGIRGEDGYFHPVGPLDALDEEDYYNDVVKLKGITWLGIGWYRNEH